MEVAIISSLIATIIVQQILHYKLVKDLTLKIKANTQEYWAINQKPEGTREEGEIIYPEEADPEEYLKALKQL